MSPEYWAQSQSRLEEKRRICRQTASLEMFARLLESQCFQLPWLIQELCRSSNLYKWWLRVRVAKRTSLARTKHWARSMRTAKQELILTRAIPGSFCLLSCHSLVPNGMVLQDALTSKLETLKVVLLHMQDYILYCDTCLLLWDPSKNVSVPQQDVWVRDTATKEAFKLKSGHTVFFPIVA